MSATNIGKCHQKSHVPNWEMVRLDVFDRIATHEAMIRVEEEIEYGVRGEAIAKNVAIGDNVVMPCESGNGKQFWLLLCDKLVHIVAKTFIDSYKNTYYEGDCVIYGCY
jgi:hypothetical protein